MKLLLTSGGFKNQSIIKALQELAIKPFSELKIAFIPTAANLESGDKQDWFIKDLINLKELKFNSIDIVDISALPKSIWLARLKEADILYVEGGNTHHLMYWFKNSGLSEIIPELLKTRIYIGVSAGSMVATASIVNSTSEELNLKKINEPIYDDGLKLVDFMLTPHVNNLHFPEINFKNLEIESKKYNFPLYCLDDNSAIKIEEDRIEIVSEGEWKRYN